MVGAVSKASYPRSIQIRQIPVLNLIGYLMIRASLCHNVLSWAVALQEQAFKNLFNFFLFFFNNQKPLIKVADEHIIRNCIVMPAKEISYSCQNQIIL